jgi:hypothetical protein
VESVLVAKNNEVEPNFLSGNLNIFNVIDLIKTFEEGSKNGIVELKSRNKIGQLQFNKGNLAHAIYESKDPLEAVLAMSIWNEGIFSLKPDNVRHSQLLKLDNQQIIKECQDFIVEREKILSTMPDPDLVFYALPTLDYENLNPLTRKNLLFFKNGKTLKEFFEQDEDGSLKLLKELKSWFDKNWLVDKLVFKKKQLFLKERQNASPVKKLFSKVFSKTEEVATTSSEISNEETSIEKDLVITSRKRPYLFKDFDYVKGFAEALEDKS